MASVWFVVPIIFFATAYLYGLTTMAPQLSTNNDVSLKFPGSFDELKQIANLLTLYYDENWLYVVILFSSAYLYKQSFMIPGSVFMNVLAGAIFGVLIGFPLCCILTAIGASFCFLLSRTFGKPTLQYYFPNEIRYLRSALGVDKDPNSLIYFLIFLRLFPMTPNWLINVLCPIIEVPLHLFFISVLFGLMPYNYLCVQAGGMLASLSSLDQVFSSRTLLQLAAMASVVLAPKLLFRKQIHENMKKKT
ncbi:transmembrane protein 41A [Nilaparvata lugens]|uniref:transmembrane protein 41A n=1 Tax=Nilaparvata lugens TaxID=108931 RepID=UPI00193DE359|nr:transmembrane protein 41A [Nilaparvata lugens]